MGENDSNMIDLVLTHLTHPWGPPGTLETLGDPWRPLATIGDMPENGNFGHFQACRQALKQERTIPTQLFALCLCSEKRLSAFCDF